MGQTPSDTLRRKEALCGLGQEGGDQQERTIPRTEGDKEPATERTPEIGTVEISTFNP